MFWKPEYDLITTMDMEQVEDAAGIDPFDAYSDEGIARFVEWCSENNAYYYSKPRESFFIPQAFAECIAAGKFLLVLDDLS